ncbi:MAG: ubiquinone biosynthesis protein UbiJ [Lysobacterales bacterium]|jgi:ubiquinone biosynthesis protein UbiJ
MRTFPAESSLFIGDSVPEYRTPLPQMMADFIELGVNRVLALDPESAKRVLKLQGKVLQVDLVGLEITLFLSFDSGHVLVNLISDSVSDTTISGTPMALFAMAAPGDSSNWGLPGSSVQISGDANLARDIERIFSQMNADWEKPLTDIFGDVAGYQFSSGLKQGAEALKKAAGQSLDMAGAYFRDESDVLVRPEELKEFNFEVDGLSDAIDRLEARIKNLGRKET